MSDLIQKLNQNLNKTPDQIVEAITNNGWFWGSEITEQHVREWGHSPIFVAEWESYHDGRWWPHGLTRSARFTIHSWPLRHYADLLAKCAFKLIGELPDGHQPPEHFAEQRRQDP